MLRRAIAGWIPAEANVWTPAVLVVLVVLSACGADTGVETATPDAADEEIESPTAEPIRVLAGGAHLSTPAVAIDESGIVFVAWVDGLTADAHVMHRYLSPGRGWSEAEMLSEGFEYNGSPKLLVDPRGSVCVFWHASVPEAGLYERCFGEDGWGAAETAVEPRGLTAGFAPAFAPDGSTVAAHEIPPSFIGFGDTALTVEGVTAGAPAFAVDSAGGFHVVWTQFADQAEESGMVYRSSNDGGATWSELERLDPTGLLTHDLVADGHGNVHWLHVDGTYRRWTPTDGWSQPAETDGGGRLAVDGDGRAWAVFPGIDGVSLAERQDDGAWSDARLVEPTAGGPVDAAVLAIDPAGVFHLVYVTSGEESAITYLSLP